MPEAKTATAARSLAAASWTPESSPGSGGSARASAGMGATAGRRPFQLSQRVAEGTSISS